MLRVEVQYLSECPLVNEMIENVDTAISNLDFKVEFIQTEIDKNQDSEKLRGCPTLLVDGRDYEGKVKYENVNHSVENIEMVSLQLRKSKLLFCVTINDRENLINE